MCDFLGVGFDFVWFCLGWPDCVAGWLVCWVGCVWWLCWVYLVDMVCCVI